MLSLLTIVIGYAACRLLPRLLAEAIATIIGVLIVLSSRRACRALVSRGADAGTRSRAATWDRTTRRERRLMRTSLRAAIRSTEFTSLFPSIAIRAHRIANLFN
ncbi:hypothetical protein [Sphingomonas sp. NPDC079357]|uniref:hypothetical protein n=1 Tax=Sphingomonas sp. NPDC079357 TaxID=3364518 RepID=UPI003851195C